MEARIGGETLQFYGVGGKRSMEWDLNDWKWDGDLFIASPLNKSSVSQQFFPVHVAGGGSDSNTSSSCSDEVNIGIDERGKGDLDQKRRVAVVEDAALNDEAGGLTLKLGEHGYSICDREAAGWEGMSGKKTKLAGGSSTRAVCQVEDCGADLSNAKDYHRRHKVCEMHSKAIRELVGNVMQRFCQQCSRFHVLQEFDEGKRSCRRRLAGHNKRRRKTNHEAVPNGSSVNDDQTSSYLLISLLKILSNMHSNKSDRTTDQDLLSHLLKSLSNQNGEYGRQNVAALLQGKSEMVSSGVHPNRFQGPPRLLNQQKAISTSEMQHQVLHQHDARGADIPTTSFTKQSILNSPPACSEVRHSAAGQIKMNNFDLNDVYIDLDDGTEDIERSPVPVILGTGSLDYPSMRQDSHQSSPPRTSRNSDSASAQSPSSSSGEAQSRTDRIVFKLFGKEPNDFPLVLRAQILDWLSHSPTDIESYIRPGCVILTIYLRQTEAVWEELCNDLSSCLNRLMNVSDNDFWRTGWMYIRVQHHIAFIFNGQVVIDTSLSFKSINQAKILSVKPIAVTASEKTQFLIKGFNLVRPATRLLCALEGEYLVHEAIHESMNGIDCSKEFDEIQCTNFSCSIPSENGRGFFEIEDQSLCSSFFPFLVAEEDVCYEIRMLENILESTDIHDSEGAGKLEAKTEAMDFIHEMGWLLHRSQLKLRLGHLHSDADLFPSERFKWLMEFCVDHDWCAVVKKLLNLLFDGIVSAGEHSALHLVLSDMGLLHKAVRKNSRQLVALLLSYLPENISEKLGPEDEALFNGGNGRFFFRPDVSGPAGLTPLHIAAGKDGSEDVLDALTDDPCEVGIEAWKGARDSTGSTPEDYARLRGHYSYIHLVQKKINKKQASSHVVVDIPRVLTYSSSNQKQNEGFEIEKAKSRHGQGRCKLCDHKLALKTASSRSLVYKPAMFSMVGIAAVCVCVALLFKSSPEVVYVFRPFRWEYLDYGPS